MLMGIAVRQIGVATPTMFSFILDEWKRYERVLFHRPALALAKLLGIGATLCHCKKDASVAYTRHIFEDTSKMRDWRNEVLRIPGILSTYIPSADQAYRARKMLLCNKVYFNNRLRLRRYQAVCIGNPHPEYMCQGGAMQRIQVLRLVDAIKQSIPSTVGPDALAVIEDVERVMIYVASHFNRYDLDAFDTLQVDLQIFLYLFQRVLSEDSAGAQSLDSLLHNSRLSVLSAANRVTESYALRLWAFTPPKNDLIKYGVVGDEPLIKSGRGSKKRALDFHDLVDTFHPDIIPKIHEWAPPSVLWDDDNIPGECKGSEIQRHPGAQCFRFLFGLYRVHHMWAKATKRLAAQGGGTERVVIDHEFVDLPQQPRVLYKCTSTGVAALEVHLQGNAATELLRKEVPPRGVMRDARFRPEDVEAEKVVMQLCPHDETGGQNSLKAVLVGPFPLHDVHGLEEEVARYHQWKETLGVQPDLVYVKEMMYTGSVGDNMEGKVPGRIYAWVVYVPSLNIDDNHAIMTIRELEAKARQDATLDEMARSITGTAAPTNRGDTLAPSAGPSSSPMLRAIAVMKQTCGESSNWKISDNYVSFDLQVDGAEVVVKNACIHTIAETLLGSFPNYRSTIPADARTTAQDIQSTLDELSERGINVELGHFERLMVEGKPAVSHTEGPKTVVPASDPVPSSAHQVIPPSHERLALEAITVMEKIKGTRDFISFLSNIDLLQGIFNQLKPSSDPPFRFQRDQQDGGMIYWQGRYRKWFYLLHKKKVGSDVPEKQYLNIWNPGMCSNAFKRKVWVAMNASLREKVVNKEMTLTDAAKDLDE
jgi:hypothetical protein